LGVQDDDVVAVEVRHVGVLAGEDARDAAATNHVRRIHDERALDLALRTV
jgi:hypothetical protein